MERSTSAVKKFKVTDVSEKKKYLMLFDTYQTFVKRCKAKFGIPDESSVYFVSEDDKETELDSDILEMVQEDKSLLIMKVEANVNNQKEKQGKAKSDTSDEAFVYFVTEDDNETELDSDILEKVKLDKNLLLMKVDAYNQQERQDGDEDSKNKEFDDGSDFVASGNIEEAEEKERREIDEGSDVKDHILKFGLNDIGKVLKGNLDKWKEKPLNIAVIGASGKGKSSFINALRGMSPRDEGAAKVDAKETTYTPTEYRHPERENFVLWDIPGAGTPNFPCNTYLTKINVNRYDFFIIVVTERFTEIDCWLMNEIQKRGKRYYMVRTKIDMDMANMQYASGGDFNELEAFNELKRDLKSEITEKSRVKDDSLHFFMISNHNTHKYDFKDLEIQLVKDVPKEKKHAMVYGVAGLSLVVIEEKAEALRSRIWKIALLSAAGEAIPIPFLSVGIDAAIILEEVLFYRSQFALDDDSLEKLAKMANVSLDTFKENVRLQTPEELFTVNGMAQFILAHTAAGAAEKIAKYTLPVIGSVISCSASYGTTHFILTDILETMTSDALRVLNFVAINIMQPTDH